MLDFDEFCALCRDDYPHLATNVLRSRFESVDADNSGKVSMEEYAKFVAEEKVREDEERRKLQEEKHRVMRKELAVRRKRYALYQQVPASTFRDADSAKRFFRAPIVVHTSRTQSTSSPANRAGKMTLTSRATWLPSNAALAISRSMNATPPATTPGSRNSR